MVLGVRPDDIVLSDRREPDYNNGRISIVEPLGTTQLIHIAIVSATIVASASVERRYKVGEEIAFKFKSIYLFDRKSGDRVLECSL
jgi:ABC-type sugar transport system ATPase subunit